MTIPAAFRRRLGIGADSLLRMTVVDGELRMRPVEAPETAAGSAWLAELYTLFAPAREEAEQNDYADAEINEAIDQAIAAVRRRHA